MFRRLFPSSLESRPRGVVRNFHFEHDPVPFTLPASPPGEARSLRGASRRNIAARPRLTAPRQLESRNAADQSFDVHSRSTPLATQKGTFSLESAAGVALGARLSERAL
jgi:hypothetical protein